MSARHPGTALLGTGTVLALVPQRAFAHALGSVLTIPFPLGVYLAAAGAAVAASFVAAVLVVRPAGAVARYAAWPIGAVVLGNPWPSLSPFRTVVTGLGRVAGLVGLTRLDACLRLPAVLRLWIIAQPITVEPIR